MNPLIERFERAALIIHQRSPSWLKKLYGPIFLWRHSDKGKGLFKTFLPVSVFTGKSATNGEPITIAYAGHDKRLSAHWLQRFFKETPNEKFIGTLALHNIKPEILTNHQDCQLVLYETSPVTKGYHRRQRALIFPAWIKMGIDISVPMETLIRESRKGIGELRRRIRKNGLDYTLTNELETFIDFYHNMYVPFTERRHQDSAVLLSEDNALELFKSSQLLLIHKDGDILAGSLIVAEEKATHLKLLGVKQNDSRVLKTGSIGATYYFAISILQDQKASYLDIGLTSPLLNDSLTSFKRHLNSEITPLEKASYPQLALHILNFSNTCKNLLEESPLVFYDSLYHPNRAIFLEPDHVSSQTELKKIVESGGCKGLNQTVIYCFSDPAKLEPWLDSRWNSILRSADELRP